MHHSLIVIGAGPGGLGAAALSARRGNRPLVLSAGMLPGGMASCIDRDGFRFHPVLPALTGFEPDGPLGLFLEELEISAPIYELHGEACLSTPEESVFPETGGVDPAEPQADEFRACLDRIDTLWRQLKAFGLEGAKPDAAAFAAPLPEGPVSELADLGTAPSPVEKAGPASLLKHPLFLPSKGTALFFANIVNFIRFQKGGFTETEHTPSVQRGPRGYSVICGGEEHTADRVLIDAPASAVDCEAELFEELSVNSRFRTFFGLPESTGPVLCAACFGMENLFPEEARLVNFIRLRDRLPVTGADSLHIHIHDSELAPEGMVPVTVLCPVPEGFTADAESVGKELLRAVKHCFPETADAASAVGRVLLPAELESLTGSCRLTLPHSSPALAMWFGRSLPG